MIDNQTAPQSTPQPSVSPMVSPNIQESAAFDQNNQTSPPPQKKFNPLLGIGLVIVLLIGLGTTYFLSQQSQDIRQQATTCNEQCPGSDGVLRNCTPPEADGSAEESICAWAGRVQSCGGTNYCCPQAGGAWTTNMTACQPSPTPSPSPSASPSPSPVNCVEQCPGPDQVLRNCTPPEADGSAAESMCNLAGRIEVCGGIDYCCPENNGEWTTDLTACDTSSPSPSASPSPNTSPSPSSSPKASPSPSPSPSSSPDNETTPAGSTKYNSSAECIANCDGECGGAGGKYCFPTLDCNEVCTINSQCQTTNSNYICYQGKCRLDSNPTSTICASATSTNTQPALPAELPVSGSEDVINWLKAGLGAIGIGAALLLLL